MSSLAMDVSFCAESFGAAKVRVIVTETKCRRAPAHARYGSDSQSHSIHPMHSSERHPAHALWCDPEHGIVSRISQRPAHERTARRAHRRAGALCAADAGGARAMWAAHAGRRFRAALRDHAQLGAQRGRLRAGRRRHRVRHGAATCSLRSPCWRARALRRRAIALAGRLVEIALATRAVWPRPSRRTSAWHGRERVRGVVGAGKGSEWFDIESALERHRAGLGRHFGLCHRRAAAARRAGAGRPADRARRPQSRPARQQARGAHRANAPCICRSRRRMRRRASPLCMQRPIPRTKPSARRPACCVTCRRPRAGRAGGHRPRADAPHQRTARAHGVALRDETGWKLSTTRAAAHLMSALRACAYDASSDQVLDWLKSRRAPSTAAPSWRWKRACATRHARLAQLVRVRRCQREAQRREPAALDRGRRGAARHAAAARGRSPNGCRRCANSAEAGGQWTALAGDVAGIEVIAALYLDARRGRDPQARRCTLAEFTAWVRDVLEAASFVPRAVDAARRRSWSCRCTSCSGAPSARVVLPGCDEQRLPASPEPPGDWNAGAARRRWACRRARHWRRRSAPPGPSRCARRTATCCGAQPTRAASRCARARWCRCCSSMHAAADADDPRVPRAGRGAPDAASAAARRCALPLAQLVVHCLRGPAPLPLPLLRAAPTGPAQQRRARCRDRQARLRQLAACGARALPRSAAGQRRPPMAGATLR